MGRISKFSFFSSGRKTVNEAVTTGFSVDVDTATEGLEDFPPLEEVSDNLGVESSPCTPPPIRRTSSRTHVPGQPSRQDDVYAATSKMTSPSELRFTQSLQFPDPLQSLEALDVDQAGELDLTELELGERPRILQHQHSISTIKSQSEPPTYQSPTVHYPSPLGTRSKSIRKGVTFASTPDLRASKVPQEFVDGVPEVPKLEADNTVKRGRLDFRKLLSRARTSSRKTVTLANKGTETTAADPVVNLDHDKSVFKPKPRQEKITKLLSDETAAAPVVKDAEVLPQRYEGMFDPFESTKVNVRKPRPGLRHWFDAFDEEYEDGEEDDDIKENDSSLRGHGEKEIDASARRELRTPSPLSSSFNKIIAEGDAKVFDKDTSSSNPVDQRKDSLASMEKPVQGSKEEGSRRSQFSGGTAPSHTRESRFQGSDLHDQSVLYLSSDEEDSVYGDDGGVDKSLDGYRKEAEEKLASDFDDHSKPKCPVKKVNSRTNVTASKKARYSKSGVLSFSRNESKNMSSHTRQYSSIEEEDQQSKGPSPEKKESRVSDIPWLDSPTTKAGSRYGNESAIIPKSDNSTATTDLQSSSSDSNTHAEHRKLIEVTEEEEALLRIMRSKRAAVAKRTYTEGYVRSLEADKRNKFNSNKHRNSKAINPETVQAYVNPILDSPIGTAFPRPPSSRSSRQQFPPLPRVPSLAKGGSHPLDRHGPPEFPKRTSSIALGQQRQTLSRQHSFETMHQPSRACSLAGSTTASTIMPSDSVSAVNCVLPPDLSSMPPIPDPSNATYQLALSQALAYDGNDMFPSPTTAPISSPATPVFAPSAADMSASVEVVGSEVDSIVDILPDNVGRSRRRTTSSSMIMLDDRDDQFSVITAGSKSVVELKRQNNRSRAASTVADGGAGGGDRPPTTPVRQAGNSGPRPVSRKTSLPAGSSVGDDVLYAWKALGGLKNMEEVPV